MGTGFSWDSEDDQKKQAPQNPAAATAGSALPTPGFSYDQVFGSSPGGSGPAATTNAFAGPQATTNAFAGPAPKPGAQPGGTGFGGATTNAGETTFSDAWGGAPEAPEGGSNNGFAMTNGGGSQGGSQTPGDGAFGGSGSPAATTKYTDAVNQIAQTTDPAQKAVLQDKLARETYAELKAAGHDVKWDGDQLVVDGRRYMIAGNGSSPTSFAPGEPTPGGEPAPAAGAGTVGQYGMPAGAVDTKFNDPNYHSPKYDLLRTVSKYPPTSDGMKQAIAEMNANGGHYQIVGDDRVVDTSNGDSIDLIQDVGGPNAKWWFGSELEYANAHPGAGAPPPAAAAAAGPAPSAQAGPTGAAGVSVGGASSYSPSAAPAWSPSAPSYQPGEITMDDVPRASYDDLMAQMPTPTPTPLETNYDFGGLGDLGQLGGGKTDAQTEDLVSSILAHPESLDPKTVEMLKGKSKDELGEMQLTNDDAMRATGAQAGIGDSNWLASERLQQARDRDAALVGKNRDIDILAAQTAAADKRSAATLGASYAGSKAARNLAERGQRMTEAATSEGLRGQAFDRRNAATQANVDNMFKSSADRRAAVQLASDTSLKAAAVRGDRMALRETIKQKAAELGQNADKVQLDYTMGLIDDATRRYGIDVGASLDRAKLTQAGREFQEDLAFKIMALQQADSQFSATYGLQAGQLQLQAQNQAFNQYQSVFS